VSPRQQYSAPSVRQLAAAVDQMRDKVSPQRFRQLRMVVGMWDRAMGREGMPLRTSRSAAKLFARGTLHAFWDLAAAGELRARPTAGDQELPVWTLRIVRDCLLIMARAVLPEGQTVELPSVSNGTLRSTVAPQGLAALYRGLVDVAAAGPLERDGVGLSVEDRTRLLALVVIVLDAAPRLGELTALRLDDLAPDLAAVGIRRRQQRAGPNRADEIAAIAEMDERTVRAMLAGELERASEETRQRVLAAAASLEPLPEVEWYELREGSRIALRRWLAVRERLIESLPLAGGRSALWVTLVATKAGPPGITISSEGLQEAFTRGMTALNVLMAGRYGWEPMPLRLEQLRRSVTVTPLDGPPG
jgi:hypothetical protein